LVLGMDQRRAHGTSLGAIVPIAVAGAAGYALEGAVDWTAGALLSAGAVGGAVLGTYLLGRVPERGLRIAFAVFLVAAAVALPLEVRAAAAPRAVDVVSVVLLLVLGLVAGTMGGLGVGGGIVMVPGLTLLLALSQAVAKGTSLMAIIPAALVGTARNVRAGRSDLPVALAAGLGGVGAAFAASLVAVRLDPLLSAVLFGLLLAAVALRLVLAVRGRPLPGDTAR
jgi:uncharacterized membrane protein YfcA